MLGLYIHIPFCAAICNYCDFNRGLFDPRVKTAYVDALVTDIGRSWGAGEAADTILRAVDPKKDDRLKVTRCKGLREALDCAIRVIKPGVVVLLSPGGTSFDEFQDFEERGECFTRWVRELP